MVVLRHQILIRKQFLQQEPQLNNHPTAHSAQDIFQRRLPLLDFKHMKVGIRTILERLRQGIMMSLSPAWIILTHLSTLDIRLHIPY